MKTIIFDKAPEKILFWGNPKEIKVRGKNIYQSRRNSTTLQVCLDAQPDVYQARYILR